MVEVIFLRWFIFLILFSLRSLKKLFKMPSRKKYESYDEQDEIEDEIEDEFQVDYDSDGLPYINPDLHNIGMDHEKIRWIDEAHEDIIKLFNIIVKYRDDEANSQILETITYNKFLSFVGKNSYQIASTS
tara:strand:+ start:3133 stop:3522 length:390 start_codon:yes stop_codon:yes gene_type:complete